MIKHKFSAGSILGLFRGMEVKKEMLEKKRHREHKWAAGITHKPGLLSSWHPEP